MKKVLVILLSGYLFLGSLLPGNNYSEFAAIPTLMQHYQHHKTFESPRIDFVDFMLMHYSDYKHEKSDPANHSKLPIHNGFAKISTDRIVSSVLIIEPPAAILCNSVDHSINCDPFVELALIGSVFHPPEC